MKPDGIFHDLARSAQLAIRLASHDLRAQRKETWLGLLWPVLWPLAQAGGFVLAFNLIRGVDFDSTTFGPVYLGVLVWSLGAGVLIAATMLLRVNRDLITQIVFPFPILSAADVLARGAILLPILLLGVMAYWASRMPIGSGSVLGFLCFLIGYLLFLLALSWVGAVVGLVAPDLSLVLPPLTMLLMALSPIFQADAFGGSMIVATVNWINPLAHWIWLFHATAGIGPAKSWAGPVAMVYGVCAASAALLFVNATRREIAKLI